MVHVQLLQIEIQSLKEALDTSQRKADRYYQLVITLHNELDQLRTDPAPSPGLNAPTTTSPIDNTTCDVSSNSAISSSIPVVPLSPPKTISDINVHIPTTNPGSESTPISPRPDSPEFSVEYNPETKRALTLHLEHVFTHKSPAWCMRISPDGQRMAVGFRNSGATIIYDMKTRSNVRFLVDRYVKDKLLIRSVKFSPDNRLLATGANDSQIRIWDITQNRMRAMFQRHTNEVNSISFSPDGRSLVSGSDDRSVRIWNIRDGSSRKLPGSDGAGWFFSVVFSPDGRYIAASDGTRDSLWIWDSRTISLVANWKGHTFVCCVQFTPDGKGLMSGGDTTVKYWDVSSLGILDAVSGRETVVAAHAFPLIRSFSIHTDTVYSIAFLGSNNEWVITASKDRSVRVWDIRTGVWQLVVQGHLESVRGVDISYAENLVATASLDQQVVLWRYEVL